ncbi:mechanosensitive ion channel protein 1, mitochondrial-like isoform X2 [Populus nigra]|uniref:mechanosensitive ion channel protein 1, mitochondrial-like isoform X2 n=1 Tax=Populus nigra TaxID=3691 RepID=UPI002B2720E0|nr:mechanosensitive ion channel protein 1, mitochondrial-like isoform X2 [Populus nigra]
MAGLRLSMLKNSLCISINSLSWQSLQFCNVHGSTLRSAYAIINRGYYKDESRLAGNLTNFKVVRSGTCVNSQSYRIEPVRGFSSTSSNVLFQSAVPFISMRPELSYRSFSWSSGGKVDKPVGNEVPASSGGNDVDVSNSGAIVSDWINKVKEAWQSTVDAVTYSGQKAIETSDELTPYAQQLLDSHPYLKNVVVPVGSTLTGTVVAWVVMPRLLRRFHKYSLQTPAALLSGGISGEQIPYEKSILGALEDPLRYVITFMAFSQIAVMVAPTTIASQYIAQVWRGAAILSFVWFLHRWKTNVFNRVIASATVDQEKLLTLDRVSSVGLFVIGLMALAEACGVAVQSFLTVGGIGGVATAFAAKDVLGNVLSGLSMQFSKPFSLGDTIKAGSIEGQVVEMGLTTTSLLNVEQFPVLVPNSLFSSQLQKLTISISVPTCMCLSYVHCTRALVHTDYSCV